MFKNSYDGIKGKQAHVRIRPDVEPVYCKPRPWPYLLKSEVKAEIKRIEQNSVRVKPDPCDWATPILVVPKADNTVRLGTDLKVTINQMVDGEQYPLP